MCASKQGFILCLGLAKCLDGTQLRLVHFTKQGPPHLFSNLGFHLVFLVHIFRLRSKSVHLSFMFPFSPRNFINLQDIFIHRPIHVAHSWCCTFMINAIIHGDLLQSKWTNFMQKKFLVLITLLLAYEALER